MQFTEGPSSRVGQRPWIEPTAAGWARCRDTALGRRTKVPGALPAVSSQAGAPPHLAPRPSSPSRCRSPRGTAPSPALHYVIAGQTGEGDQSPRIKSWAGGRRLVSAAESAGRAVHTSEGQRLHPLRSRHHARDRAHPGGPVRQPDRRQGGRTARQGLGRGRQAPRVRTRARGGGTPGCRAGAGGRRR